MARNKISSAAIVLGAALAASCVNDASDDATEEYGDASSKLSTVMPGVPSSHPRIYLTPNRARLAAALTANTPAAAKFRTRVDQWLAGTSIWGFEAWNGALMTQLSGNTAYCTKSVGIVEAQVKAAEAAIAAGTAPVVARDHYLHIGELVGDLALVYDWCYPQVTPTQRTRWIAYANQAVSNVWNHTTAKWGAKSFPWSGWSVNNPSNNYFYSFLRATMLVGLATKGENGQADGFLTKFRQDKIINQLVPTFTNDLVGGASREGTGYGVAMRKLYELYALWMATTGEQLATATPHTRASLLAFIHQTMPALDRVAPTGDHARERTAAFFDYHRDYLQQLMQIFPTDPLAKRAKYLLTNSTVPAMTQSFMAAYDFLYDNPSVVATPLTGLNTTYHAKGIGQIYARSGWDKAATWVNLTAGPYTESHAHQDQGSIMIFKGGWLAHDANVHSKSGLSQTTTSHSLVRIDSGTTPIKQVASTVSTVLALKTAPTYVYAAADLTPAYKGNAAIQKVQREMVYLQPNVVIVFDRVQTSSTTTQTWQLSTPVAPVISGNTATITSTGHSLEVTRIAPTTGTMTSYDQRANTDLTGGFRLDEKMAGGDQRYLNVMSIDGAVTSALATGTTAQPGVTINLANGQQVTVKFNRDTVGGTLTMAGTTTTLAAGVQALAE